MLDQAARSVKGLGALLSEGCRSLPGPVPALEGAICTTARESVGGQECTRAQHEELMAEEGYRLVRDTPLARVLPWRILEFRHG